MSRIIVGTLLLAASVCFGNSRVQADDAPNRRQWRPAPNCQPFQGSHRSLTVRGQQPDLFPGVRGPASLPRGRAYYNNRYFGNFNNRFYGPQYGYF